MKIIFIYFRIQSSNQWRSYFIFYFISNKRPMYRSPFSYSQPKPYTSLNLPKSFPQDIECIIKSSDPEKGSLYISNIEAAENPATLRKHKITAILSCAKDYQLNHSKTIVPHYKYFPAVDHDAFDISIHFDEAVDFIHQNLKRTNVLAHCIAGVSRSVSMVIAYFIREHNLEYDQAYKLVKTKRKIIHPNDGFIKQLRKYQQNKKKVQRVYNHPHQKQNELKHVKIDRDITPTKQAKVDHNHTTIYNNYMQYTPKTSSNKDSFNFSRSNTNYFTPIKSTRPQTCDNSIRSYEKYSQSVKLQKYVSPKLNEEVVTPKNQKSGLRTKNNQTQYFQSMNKQLNDKIESIRKKYEDERKKLYQKYQSTELTSSRYGSQEIRNQNGKKQLALSQSTNKNHDEKYSVYTTKYEPYSNSKPKQTELYTKKYASPLRQSINRDSFVNDRYGKLLNYNFPRYSESIYGIYNSYNYQSKPYNYIRYP